LDRYVKIGMAFLTTFMLVQLGVTPAFSPEARDAFGSEDGSTLGGPLGRFVSLEGGGSYLLPDSIRAGGESIATITSGPDAGKTLNRWDAEELLASFTFTITAGPNAGKNVTFTTTDTSVVFKADFYVKTNTALLTRQMAVSETNFVTTDGTTLPFNIWVLGFGFGTAVTSFN